MTAKQLLDAGELSPAINQISEELKKDPANRTKRTFLFELLCCWGDLDRAVKHLDILGSEGADAELAVAPYRGILEGEKRRRLLFTNGVLPGLPKKIPGYTNFHLEAIQRIREGHYEEARQSLENAEAIRPHVHGTINGEPFDDLKDADDVIGPFLEVIVGSNYSWVPWEMVNSVNVVRPEHLRDLVWIPARVDLHAGSLGHVFLPVLYAGSYLNSDNQVKLGRTTEWRQDAGGLALAAGQKMLVADDRDWPLLEIHDLEMEVDS